MSTGSWQGEAGAWHRSLQAGRPESMAANALTAVAGPSSGPGGLPPYPVLGLAQPGRTLGSQPSNWALTELWRSNWTSGRLVAGMGVFHLLLGSLTLAFGSALTAFVAEVHLVVLKSWFPFWGAASSLCLAMHLVSGLCVLAGLFVLSKDLFLESPYLWPIWTPYPNPMASLQWLELALFCICWVELVLPVPTIMAAHRWRRRAAEDRGGVSPAPRVLPLELTHPSPGPPPSYEEATRGDA
ncbi:membrane-spanning 4-domains subfamily A member 10 isoform X2 [Cavia porcellus]|uniref:membrane-spanning 4-domains subfamily A member 10 isoform X2 n=1 Tax=Cavia porcellus TaxID=10141 RepID=UPI002FE3EC50